MLVQRMNSYIPFLLVYILAVGLPSPLGFGQTLITSVNRWFVRRKSTAFAILLTGFAAGGAIFVFPLGLGVEHIGWRSTLFFSGVFVLVVGVLLSWTVRHSPERMGIPPEGTEAGPGQLPASGSHPTRNSGAMDFSVSEAMHTIVFWFMLAASTLRISAETGIMVHIIPIMVWKGIDDQTAAGLVSIFFFLSIPFRLLLGVSGQKFPFQPLIVTGMVSADAGLKLVVMSGGTWGLYPFVVRLAVYEGSVVLQGVSGGDFLGRWG